MIKNLGDYAIKGKNVREKHPNWKGGVSLDKQAYNKKCCKEAYYRHREERKKKALIWRNNNKEGVNLRKRLRRHEGGESKKYIFKYGGVKTSKKIHRQRYKALFKNGGPLAVQTIQLVYEDNIKKYGTLTCYLCLKPILFGKDNLEHKTPLSRGGTNKYNNLAIACQRCNCKKHNKTYEEFFGKEKKT